MRRDAIMESFNDLCEQRGIDATDANLIEAWHATSRECIATTGRLRCLLT